MTDRMRTYGCPCTLVTPCSAHCTCADPVQSGGCKRCASYGSVEQRTRTAEWIARLLKSALEHELKLRATIRNGSDKEAASAIAEMLAPLIIVGSSEESTHPLDGARLDLFDAIQAQPPNYDGIMAAANNYVIAWGEWDYAGRKS